MSSASANFSFSPAINLSARSIALVHSIALSRPPFNLYPSSGLTNRRHNDTPGVLGQSTSASISKNPPLYAIVIAWPCVSRFTQMRQMPK